jgi:hypothetical protein
VVHIIKFDAKGKSLPDGILEEQGSFGYYSNGFEGASFRTVKDGYYIAYCRGSIYWAGDKEWLDCNYYPLLPTNDLENEKS